tara:strand:- start:1086 stop:1952 length:867 start_codon:yes stop_codon:yes gene_type:complete
MTIKQQGGVFGRNPTFNTADIDGELKAGSLDVSGTGEVNGPLLVGTGTAEAGLHVDQNVGGIYSRFKRLSSQYLDVIMTSGVNQLYAYGKTFQIGTGSNNEVIVRQNNFSRMTFETNGDVTVEGGNLVIGTSGKGIDFSATAGTGTSELFDDYEEGTWTPVPADAASGGNTGTADTDQGEYTKIGNLVYIKCYLENIDTTGLTAGNDFRIQGLPYTAANTASISMNFGTCTTTGGVAFNGTIHPIVVDNTASIKFPELASSTSIDYLIVSEVSSGAADIWLSATYQTS